MYVTLLLGFPGGSEGKESACNAVDLDLIPGLEYIPEKLCTCALGKLEQEMATHSTILDGKFHGQRSLADYSSWGSQRVGQD